MRCRYMGEQAQLLVIINCGTLQLNNADLSRQMYLVAATVFSEPLALKQYSKIVGGAASKNSSRRRDRNRAQLQGYMRSVRGVALPMRQLARFRPCNRGCQREFCASPCFHARCGRATTFLLAAIAACCSIQSPIRCISGCRYWRRDVCR